MDSQRTTGGQTPRRSNLDTREGVTNAFSLHAPSDTQQEHYAHIVSMANEFGQELISLCPSSGERTLALRHLQQAVMFANASIALNE